MEIIKDKLFNLKLELNHQSTIRRTCHGCDEVIEPHSWYYVGKSVYKNEYLFHKFCGELPTEMAHPLHPKPELLRLKYPYYGDHCSCDFCNRSSSFRFMYSCESCRFNVDLMCAGDATLKLLSSKTPVDREKMLLKDVSHIHNLKLLRIQIRHDDGDDDVDVATTIQECNACQQPIIDSTYYICPEESEGCKDYSLHRFCAELPVEMKHALHPHHALMLMLSPPLKHFKCFACDKFCQGNIYSCRVCSFQLDLICATSVSRVLEHKCHQHPLTLLPRPISSFCYACCRVHEEGTFYHCNTCVVFFIHQDCASLAYEINHPSHQGHLLSLGFPSDGTQKRNDCDICYKPIYDQTGWFYYCWGCKFFSHLNCILSENDREIQEIDPAIFCLPWQETNNEFGTVGLLNMNLTSTQYDDDDDDDDGGGDDDDNSKERVEINHFSHPEHPLILQSDLPRKTNPYSDGEIALKTQCNGCCKQISAPLYSCANCHFYIHKGCALLPNFISQPYAHSDHDQCRLVLLREPWYETRVFECDDCEQNCNGFSYQCEEESCQYKIDVECAFLPSTIVHKAHPGHTLHLKLEDYCLQVNRYKCCSMSNSSYVYRCDTCLFQIHSKCAMYPAKADHRFDCDSPFMLSYNPSEIEPNEYHYCEICEEILDPKLWFYFSRKIGGQIMHPGCILNRYRAAVVNPNFKSISSFLGDIHPHPLHLHPTYRFKKCYHCEMMMEDHNNNTTDVRQPFNIAYQCTEWDCTYEIHVSCANKFILQDEENNQEIWDADIIS